VEKIVPVVQTAALDSRIKVSVGSGEAGSRVALDEIFMKVQIRNQPWSCRQLVVHVLMSRHCFVESSPFDLFQLLNHPRDVVVRKRQDEFDDVYAEANRIESKWL
jgi:hypothetical protein